MEFGSKYFYHNSSSSEEMETFENLKKTVKEEQTELE